MSTQETIADKNKAHWNNIAETYETGDPAGIKIAQDAADAMLKKYAFDENSTTLLEFACGTGVVSRRLATYCLSVTGVDISENMVKLYNNFAQETPNKDKMKGYVFDLLNSTEPSEEDDLKGMIFDVIVCAQAYHHFEDVVDATKKLATYLKPSGSLFIVDNTWFKWNTKPEGGEGHHHSSHHHHDHGHPYHRFHHDASEEEEAKLRTTYEAAMSTIAHKEGFNEDTMKELFEAAGLTEAFDFTILGQYDRAGMSSEVFVAKAAKPGV